MHNKSEKFDFFIEIWKLVTDTLIKFETINKREHKAHMQGWNGAFGVDALDVSPFYQHPKQFQITFWNHTTSIIFLLKYVILAFNHFKKHVNLIIYH